jgi:hypothetical protein
MGALTVGAVFPADPLASLAAPANPGGCVAGTAATLLPGCYTSIASTVTTLSRGTYYVTGPVDIGNLSGTDVMIYLTGSGQLTAANNKALHISAPTTGSYVGIAIFQDPADANNFSTGNNFTLDITGATYMPGVDVNFPNSVAFSASPCALFVARSLTIRNGSGAFDASGCASVFAGARFLSVAMAR